jgi:protein tyrosine/serine phosphatase
MAVPGIDNFGEVQGKECVIYRGAQPEEIGITTLREKGVRTIINLRNDPDPREEEWVKAAGMRYVHIPSDPMNPKLPDVRKYLQIVAGRLAAPFVSEPVEGPIFVHCYAGRDRTGMFVAAYRVAEQAWPTKQAIHELDAYGHNRLLFPQIHQFLRKTPAEDLRL